MGDPPTVPLNVFFPSSSPLPASRPLLNAQHPLQKGPQKAPQKAPRPSRRRRRGRVWAASVLRAEGDSSRERPPGVTALGIALPAPVFS